MYRFVKRFFDIILSFIALITLSPFLLILCLLVAVFNGSPIIFKQPRPGKNGKIFMLYKFRSMSNKTDKNGDLLPDSQRITKFGKFLRLTSLDELPQLLNILKGDMSIIGPRPKLVKDVVFYNDKVKSLMVRPGITGLAQVNGRNNNTWESMFTFDEKYVKELSFFLDLKIFFKTFAVVLGQKGTYSGENISQDYYYGDYLLRVGNISQDDYNQKLNQAKRIVENFKFIKKSKRKFIIARAEEEDFDLEHQTIE